MNSELILAWTMFQIGSAVFINSSFFVWFKFQKKELGNCFEFKSLKCQFMPCLEQELGFYALIYRPPSAQQIFQQTDKDKMITAGDWK